MSTAVIRYPKPEDGSSVSIAGSFNAWQPESMPLSSDGTQYEIKIEWQEEPVLYKFVLDSGDWVLSNEQPTITDETGVVNHQLHVATELEAALGVALEPAQVKDGAGHVAPPESVEIPADIGEEIISKETPNDEYKPNSRPLSASGPGLVEDEDNRILAVAKSISPSVESHDSHLNPSAPAFNPAAQPFVPLSNPPRDTSRIPRSSRHQRSQSSSRTSHSRSSSIVSSRPRSGSSVHHDELNPTAHEFKPQFAQPTHIVPHASGYAAALKKPASPPMKEEFKKPQTPASKSGSPRSITSFPSTGSDSRGSQDADVRNGSSSSGTLSYAEMAKHAAAKAQVPGSALMSTDAEAQPPQEKSASIAKSVELNAENQSERTSSATSVIQQGTEQMAIPKTENISDNEEREPSADAKSAIGADPGPVPSKIIDDKATIEAVPGDKQTAHLRNDTSGTTRKSITADESDATKDDNDPNQGFGIETVARKSDGIPENENNASDLKEDLEAESVDEKNDVSPKDDIAPSPEAELCQEKDATVKPDSIEKSIFDVSSRSTEAVSNTAESVIGAAQERAVKVADTLSKASSVTSNEAGTESEKASNAGFHRNKPESPQADADNGVAHPRLDTIELTTEEYDPEQIRLMDEVCILLDRDDNPVGSVSKKDAHLMSNITEGLLHRAFSLFLFNSDRELLLQQRAAEKITFPDMWTNTCCSHPLSVTGEVSNDLHGSIAGVKRAAQRKVEQELGIQAADAPVDKMQFLTRIHYLAPSDGKWGEHEIDYILCLRADPQLKVNVNEVRDHKWVTQEDLRDMFMSTSVTYTPWFKLICETFLFRWWDNLEQLDICVDEPTIHRLGIDSALYDKITHTEDSPSLQTQNAKATDTVITDNSPFTVRTRASESTADTTQEAISGSEETITKIKEQTSEFISTATEKVLSAAGHASQTSDALMENVRSVLAPSDIVSEHDGANLDPETSEPAAEDALPVTSSNKPTTFDSGSTSTFTESTIQSTPKQVVDAHSEPAAEGSDLTLGEARDPVESEVQASFKATRDAEAPEPSNARESILELSPAGQAKVFAHTETTSISDISRPSTGKSVRVKPSFFLYIFNSLFGGLFSGFSTMFSKLAFWRKSPHHQHSD